MRLSVPLSVSSPLAFSCAAPLIMRQDACDNVNRDVLNCDKMNGNLSIDSDV